MTRLRVVSDLHVEFAPIDLRPIGEDILVVAGDVGHHVDAYHFASEYADRSGVPVVFVAGNHEFYHSHDARYTMGSTRAALRNLSDRHPLLHFLDDSTAIVAGVGFIGGTLWTDFELYGYEHATALREMAACRMNDYRYIYLVDGKRLTPEATRDRHLATREFLRTALRSRKADVVVTHHLPSAASINPRYRDDPLNVAFASNLDDLVAASGAALWVHGHTHLSCDYHLGTTRVVCNPRGYHPHELNDGFNPDLLIEV